MKNSIFKLFIKLNLRWRGDYPILGRLRRVGIVPSRLLRHFLSVCGGKRRLKGGYEGVRKKVSGYSGRGLRFRKTCHTLHDATHGGGSMSVHYPPNSATVSCQGMSLVEVLVAITLLAISSLLLLRYAQTLHSSEQTQWQRREIWRQLAQRLEGGGEELRYLNEQATMADGGCHWQRVEWHPPNHSPLYLERLRCP